MEKSCLILVLKLQVRIYLNEIISTIDVLHIPLNFRKNKIKMDTQYSLRTGAPVTVPFTKQDTTNLYFILFTSCQKVVDRLFLS